MSKKCDFCKGKYLSLSRTHATLDWMCVRIVDGKLVFATSPNKGLSWADRGKLKIKFCPVCGEKLANDD